MKLKMIVAALAALVMVVPAQAIPYGWEDGGTALGVYNASGALDVANVSSPTLTGNGALEMYESTLGGTPQALVAFVEGLTDGDTITASFWVYDTTPSASPSGRIWGHYSVSGDVGGYSGSASGNSTYSDGSGWSQLSNTWTFDSSGGTRDAFVLEARIYSGSVGQDRIYIDDMLITTSSSTAAISIPVPEPTSIALLALGGLALIRRR